MTARRTFLPALLLSAVTPGCGEQGHDNAVDAVEANEVVVGGMAFRIQLFRELNPYEEPSIYRWPRPPAGKDLYAAFMRGLRSGR
jgi:hypothetical protein